MAKKPTDLKPATWKALKAKTLRDDTFDKELEAYDKAKASFYKRLMQLKAGSTSIHEMMDEMHIIDDFLLDKNKHLLRKALEKTLKSTNKLVHGDTIHALEAYPDLFPKERAELIAELREYVIKYAREEIGLMVKQAKDRLVAVAADLVSGGLTVKQLEVIFQKDIAAPLGPMLHLSNDLAEYEDCKDYARKLNDYVKEIKEIMGKMMQLHLDREESGKFDKKAMVSEIRNLGNVHGRLHSLYKFI